MTEQQQRLSISPCMPALLKKKNPQTPGRDGGTWGCQFTIQILGFKNFSTRARHVWCGRRSGNPLLYSPCPPLRLKKQREVKASKERSCLCARHRGRGTSVLLPPLPRRLHLPCLSAENLTPSSGTYEKHALLQNCERARCIAKGAQPA